MNFSNEQACNRLMIFLSTVHTIFMTPCVMYKPLPRTSWVKNLPDMCWDDMWQCCNCNHCLCIYVCVSWHSVVTVTIVYVSSVLWLLSITRTPVTPGWSMSAMSHLPWCQTKITDKPCNCTSSLTSAINLSSSWYQKYLLQKYLVVRIMCKYF